MSPAAFKDFYLRSVTPRLRWAFPRLVSYLRFVELMQHASIPLCAYLQTRSSVTNAERSTAHLLRTTKEVTEPGCLCLMPQGDRQRARFFSLHSDGSESSRHYTLALYWPLFVHIE